MQKTLSWTDKLLDAAGGFLETCFGSPYGTGRPVPSPTAEDEPFLTDAEKKHSAGLMRVNHVGEVCAQALYQGQALTCRDPALSARLSHAAEEENDHLRWCAERLNALNSHRSYLNPAWYVGALSIGIVAGICGDKWNLGFLAETEKQVVAHIDNHLGKLPPQDQNSEAILKQMRIDELSHAETAIANGGVVLPFPIPMLMKASSRVMTTIAYYV